MRDQLSSGLLVAALAGWACGGSPNQPIAGNAARERTIASVPTTGEASSAPGLEGEPIVALPVVGHGPAVVLVPVGATEHRPVLVATHGAGGTPEEACAFWGGVARGRAFVLCPRGRATSVYDPPDQRGYYYPDHHALIREVDAALDALAERFPDHVDPGPIAYAGFSQGAIMGALRWRGRRSDTSGARGSMRGSCVIFGPGTPSARRSASRSRRHSIG